MTIQYCRTIFAVSTLIACIATGAHAQPNEGRTAVDRELQSAQEPSTGLGNHARGTKEEKLASCMDLWEPATHMTKSRWKIVCKRIQTND
jgi:hypothetical protein